MANQPINQLKNVKQTQISFWVLTAQVFLSVLELRRKRRKSEEPDWILCETSVHLFMSSTKLASHDSWSLHRLLKFTPWDLGWWIGAVFFAPKLTFYCSLTFFDWLEPNHRTCHDWLEPNHRTCHDWFKLYHLPAMIGWNLITKICYDWQEPNHHTCHCSDLKISPQDTIQRSSSISLIFVMKFDIFKDFSSPKIFFKCHSWFC